MPDPMIKVICRQLIYDNLEAIAKKCLLCLSLGYEEAYY